MKADGKFITCYVQATETSINLDWLATEVDIIGMWD